MFDNTHYVPVLLTRRGERSALADLTEDVRSKMTPLFAVHPIDWNYETDAPSKNVDDHIASLGSKLATSWGVNRAFIDLVHLDMAEHDDKRRHPLDVIIEDAESAGLPLVPVVSPLRDPHYLSAAGRSHATNGRGICIRLNPPDWPAGRGNTEELEDLMKLLDVQPDQVDLVLDLGHEVHSGLADVLVRAELGSLVHADSWRSVTLVAGAFPKDLANMPKNTITSVERLDWQLYTEVAGEGARPPCFGDYGVAHPDPFVGTDPKLMSISAAIRYTVADDWLVAKGGLFKGQGGSGRGGDALIPAAGLLAEHEEFCGRDFCAGDRWISQVAQAGAGGGNPERWRRVATNHHLTFVTGQIASHYVI
jgi:hypothetical protein